MLNLLNNQKISNGFFVTKSMYSTLPLFSAFFATRMCLKILLSRRNWHFSFSILSKTPFCFASTPISL